LRGGVKIHPVAKSRGPKSNALAYAECALSILSGSTSAPVTFLLVEQSSPIFLVQRSRDCSQWSFFLFYMSRPVPEILAVKLERCPKLRQILDVFALPNFNGAVPPKVAYKW